MSKAYVIYSEEGFAQMALDMMRAEGDTVDVFNPEDFDGVPLLVNLVLVAGDYPAINEAYQTIGVEVVSLD